MTLEQAGILLFGFAIVCEQAHVASPIVLAWSHPGLRRIALSRPIETMLLPVVAIIGALLSPFWLIWWVYWSWNIYHFGMQHYGVLSIGRAALRRGRENSHVAAPVCSSRLLVLLGSNSVLRLPWHPKAIKWLCVGGTAVLMAGVPLIIRTGWWQWVALVALDFNHWLVDIGLSSRVSRHWWLFLAAVAVLGCVGFAWKVPRADHIATLAVPWVIQARWGVGITHFLYSRWVWKRDAALSLIENLR
jgi:hypothetical protein